MRVKKRSRAVSHRPRRRHGRKKKGGGMKVPPMSGNKLIENEAAQMHKQIGPVAV